jgi:glucuronosyltransferase
MDRMFGSVTPYAFVPHMVLYDYDDEMTFMERAHNLAFSMFDALMRKFYYLPEMNKQARKYFGNLQSPLPSVEELEKSVAVILVNSHFAMIKPRPMMPGMVNIAGSHIKPVKPLPTDIQEFLDGAEHGAIYMSLGAFVQSSKMPKEKMEMILKVFGSLKQRVLWKFETDNLPKLPPNVMVRKWLPQSDILAHPKLSLFIAHGGLFGTIEGSYRGVPILFMPFYGDQYRNAKLAESRGYAKKLLFSELTEKSLKSKINEMTTNKKYKTKAKEISRLLTDNPTEPIEEAMYWIEYAVRTNGAKHLKAAGMKLPWYKYLMLDVIGVSVIALWILLKGFQYFLSELCPPKVVKPEKLTSKKLN